MKVFITGGTGFLGQHLVRRMIQTDHTLYCLTGASGDSGELKKRGVHVITGDINDRASLNTGMHGCDWVIHLACASSWWEADKTIYQRVNVDGTRNVMECALENGVSKVVHVSSVVVYGKPGESPIREETPPAGVKSSDYAQTKYEGEQIAWQLCREKSLPLVVVYPCVMMGTGDRNLTGETIRRFITRRIPVRIFNDSVLTYVHVRDVAEAILKAAEKASNEGERYIIGNSHLSCGEFYDLICDVSGARPSRLSLPDFAVMLGARVLTRLANRIKRPPLGGMSIDAMCMLRDGIIADGSKAERELGVVYTSVRQAMDEEVAWQWRAAGRKEEALKPWSGRERRVQTRDRVDLPCVITGLFYGHETRTAARVTDLTGQGMYVETGVELDEGTEMKAQIKSTPCTEAFWIIGKVLRSTDRGMGIRFLDYAPREVDVILNSL